MLKKFRLTMYAETQAVFYENRTYLIDKKKWTNLGRHDLCTLGNNTNNRLERFHHTIQEVFQESRRFYKVLMCLIDIFVIRLSDKQLKQRIQELRFSVQKKHPAVSKCADSISPFPWSLLNKEMKIMEKNYDFVLDEHHIKKGYTHAINNEVNIYRQLEHKLNCFGKQHYQAQALNFQLSLKKHTTLGVAKMSRSDTVQQVNDAPNNNLASNSCSYSSEIEPTAQASLLIQASTAASAATEEKILPHPWSSLRLPEAVKKRGRPKENKGYFQSFHKQLKKALVEPISSVV
ncbi:Uncharacterized protein APZ42_032442 [Daphnia magna]|uniref:Uncharacterized protein n=1 Tax=Daphnia magna TaxID=35525 RepID=A0A164LZT0_9CRUS|nr:Uncharacterized protein APZ42_032442 [Daphnia magna]